MKFARIENNFMMMEVIKVSVIIPIYNVESFISETLDSVLNQTLKEIEIVLVDDGSTDLSLEICKKFAVKDDRISVFSQNNQGVSIARNNGLLKANGEYVFFMDSDDTIDSEFLRGSYDIAKNENRDIVIIGEYFCNRTINTPALATCAQLLKKEFLDKYPDIRFPKGIQPCEDGLFSHQILALTRNIGLNPNGIYYYRSHENQNHLKIHENYDKVLNQIPMWFNILIKFYSDFDLFKSHSLHLSLFLEHEPYEFRYTAYKLNDEQKCFLHKIIKDFYNQFVSLNISQKEKNKLSVSFQKFISSETHKDFDKFYKRFLTIKKMKLFAVNLIPIKSIRKQLRKKINIIYK